MNQSWNWNVKHIYQFNSHIYIYIYIYLKLNFYKIYDHHPLPSSYENAGLLSRRPWVQTQDGPPTTGKIMLVWLKPILNLNNHIIANDVYSCSCLLHPYTSIERGCKRTCEIIIRLYILKSRECICTKGPCFVFYLNSDLNCHWFGWERWDQT